MSSNKACVCMINNGINHGDMIIKVYNNEEPMKYCCGTYTGQTLNGLPHGQGKFLGTNSNYTGEFRMGCWHGQGKATYSNGASYTGAFKEGDKHG